MEYIYVSSSRFFNEELFISKRDTCTSEALSLTTAVRWYFRFRDVQFSCCSFFAFASASSRLKTENKKVRALVSTSQYGTAVVSHLLYFFRSTKAWRQILFKAFKLIQIWTSNATKQYSLCINTVFLCHLILFSSLKITNSWHYADWRHFYFEKQIYIYFFLFPLIVYPVPSAVNVNWITLSFCHFFIFLCCS